MWNVDNTLGVEFMYNPEAIPVRRVIHGYIKRDDDWCIQETEAIYSEQETVKSNYGKGSDE